jgi:4-amino-4-deoxychorismate lyase
MMLIINGKQQEVGTINFDSGYSFGRGAFETILVTDRPIFLREHCERLKEGLKKLGISTNISEEYILDIIQTYNITNCALKLIVSEKNRVIETRLIQYTEGHYKKGFKLKVSDLKRNPHSIVTYLKTVNYTDNILEREKAVRLGFDEVLFLNSYGKVSEGSVSNIFFLRDSRLITPSVDCGLLNGIMRSWLINNFEVVEGKFVLEDLMNSQGVFLTNSIMGIMKVSSIDDTEINYTPDIDRIREKYESTISLL